MKIRTERDQLAKALKLVAPIAVRPSLPALNGVRIDVGKTITLTCTNLDVTCTTDITGDIEGKGVALPPVALLNRIVGVLPAGAVTLELDAGNLTVTNGDDEAVIRCIEIDGWPKLLPLPEVGRVELTRDDCARIAAIAPFCSSNSQQPLYTSVHLEKGLAMCTDSYRFGAAEVGADLPDCNVPRDFLVSVLGDVDDAGMSVEASANDARFTTANATWTTRLVAGEFPSTWRSLARMEGAFKGEGVNVEFDRDEMIGALKRLDVIANTWKATADSKSPGTSHPVKITQDGGKLLLSAVSQDVGNMSTVIACRGDMPEPVAFNAQYLSSVLVACTDEMVSLNLIDRLKPGVIHNGPHTLLAMPVRVG